MRGEINMAWWKGGWKWSSGSPWPGNGPWNFLPPWLRPGWYLGRGYCRYIYGPGAGWYLRYRGWIPPQSIPPMHYYYYYWSAPRAPWYWHPWW